MRIHKDQTAATKPLTQVASFAEDFGSKPPAWQQHGQLRGGGGFKGLAFLPHQNRLVAASFDGRIQMWDIDTMEQLASLAAHDGLLGTFAVSRDGRLLASVDFRRNLKIWDTETWECLATHRASSVLYCVAFSPDGVTLATSGERVVEFWRVGDQDKWKQIVVDIWPISGLEYSPDGKTLFVAGADNLDGTLSSGEGGLLKAYDVDSCQPIGEFKTQYQPSARALTISANDPQLILACHTEVHCLRWERHDDQLKFDLRYTFSRVHGDDGSSFEAQFGGTALHLQENWLAVSAGSPGPRFPAVGHVELVDARTGNPLAALVPERSSTGAGKIGEFDVTHVAFSTDGRFLAAAGKDQAISVWKKSTEPGDRFAMYQSPEMAAIPSSEFETIESLDEPASLTAGGRKLRELQYEYRQRLRQFASVAAQSQDQPDRDALLLESLPQPAVYVEKLLALAEAHRDEETALDSLALAVFLLTHTAAYPLESERATVLRRLRDGHVNDADLSRVFYLLERWPWKEAGEFLRHAAQVHDDERVRGHAWFSLGNWSAQRAKSIRRLELSNGATDDSRVSQYVNRLRQAIGDASEDDCVALAEECFQRVIDDYPRVIQRPNTYVRLADPENADISGWRKRFLGELAEHARRGLHRLSIGQVAMEIVGEDADGERFQLSDYRGKVVVLAFSGNWCGSCVAMYPQYRDMVEQLADRPFVLLHVNSDSSRKELQRDIQSGKVTWRSWWDGGSTNGPIATQWQVQAWPAIYVLDQSGIIRHKDLRGEQLARAVDQLLDELDAQNADDAVLPPREQAK